MKPGIFLFRFQACVNFPNLLFQDCAFGQYSVRCILDQDVLLQEDVELIELLDPSLLTLSSSPSGSSSRANALPRPGFIARPSVWCVVTVLQIKIQILADDLLPLVTWNSERMCIRAHNEIIS